jgi:glycosyltransferase involved in cell wall biosynthesis
MDQRISVVLAARNEAKSIAEVLRKVKNAVPNLFETLVVDDCSNDSTCRVAQLAGAVVLRNQRRLGQTPSLRKALSVARGDVIITMDADGEHDPQDICRFIKGLRQNIQCVVVGRRATLPRISEKLLSVVFRPVLGVTDIICGFRAIPREVLDIAKFDKYETWGLTFLLSCSDKSVCINEVPLTEWTIRASGRTGGRFLGNLKVVRCLFIGVAYLIILRITKIMRGRNRPRQS